MDVLFWTSFGAMALLLLMRFVVPLIAPETLLSRWLTAIIKPSEDEHERDRETR